jgi:hypothetical protein
VVRWTLFIGAQLRDLEACRALKLLIAFDTSFLAQVVLSATQQSVLCKGSSVG